MLTRSKLKMSEFEKINQTLIEIKDDLKTKASNAKIDELLEEIKSKDVRIVELERKMEKLEILESRIAILENNNVLLERKIDDNEQYSRRFSLRINGIPLPGNGVREPGFECLEKVKDVLKNLPETIPECMFDRAHRVGKKKIDEEGNVRQQMIVRMCSWKARTVIYQNRKVLKNHRCYLDLTHRRFKLKLLAEKKVEGNVKVEFVLADINCSLSMKIKNGGFKYFNTEEELDNILNGLE